MRQIQYKRQWFYLLAAVVLLLQSFAIWHNATHPFHTSEIQCERFNAINHLPGADLQAEISIAQHFVSVSTEQDAPLQTLPARQREQHPIRAPPTYS